MSSIHSEWSSLGHVCPKPSYKWAQRAGVNSFRPVIWPHHKGSLGWPRASWGPQKMAIRTSPKRPSRTGSTGPPGQVRGDFPRRPCPCALTRFGTRSLSLLVQPCTFHLPAVPWISPSHFFHSHHNPSTAPHLPSNPSRPSSLISKQLLLTLPGVLTTSLRLHRCFKKAPLSKGSRTESFRRYGKVPVLGHEFWGLGPRLSPPLSQFSPLWNEDMNGDQVCESQHATNTQKFLFERQLDGEAKVSPPELHLPMGL